MSNNFKQELKEALAGLPVNLPDNVVVESNLNSALDKALKGTSTVNSGDPTLDEIKRTLTEHQNAYNAELNKKFDKTGGAISTGVKIEGNLITQQVNTDRLYLSGGDKYNTGATIQLFGINLPNSEYEKGNFYIKAVSPEKDTYLRGTPSGSLSWDNKDLERVNSSGDGWIRYDSGIQICWGEVSFSGHEDNSQKEVTFPLPFINGSYSTSATPIPWDAIATCGSKSGPACFVRYRSSTGQQVAGKASWLAIGRWK